MQVMILVTMRIKPIKTKLETAEQVYSYAMNLLNYRDYSSKEMFLKLLSRGASEENSKLAIAKLLANGFINEMHFAKQVYRHWLNKKDYGKRNLFIELHRKNVSEDCIPVIMDCFTEEMEEVHAQRAIELFIYRKFSRIKYNEKTLAAAATRFMTNRGFPPKYIQVLLDTVRKDDDM